MNIHKLGLNGIADRMVAKLDQAETRQDYQAAILIARVIACAAHQLTLENAGDDKIADSAEKLLAAQGALLGHEQR